MFGYTTLSFIINHNTYFRLPLFSDIHISQGSVATHLRCGGIYKYNVVANLPLSLSAKEFWKSVNIWGRYGHEFTQFSVFFWLTVYIVIICNVYIKSWRNFSVVSYCFIITIIVSVYIVLYTNNTIQFERSIAQKCFVVSLFTTLTRSICCICVCFHPPEQPSFEPVAKS